MRFLPQYLRYGALVALLTLLGWYLSGAALDWIQLPLGIYREMLRGALMVGWLGLSLTLGEYALLDWELLTMPAHWLARAVQGLILGALMGTGFFALTYYLMPALGYSPLARVLSWAVVGLALGLIEGIKSQSWRRTSWALGGASLGGILGALCVIYLPLFLTLKGPWIGTYTAALTMVLFGALTGVGMSVSQVLSRFASLTVLAAPLPKQIGQTFAVGAVGTEETLGKLKTTHTLTGDHQIRDKHCKLLRQGSSYTLQPLEDAQVRISREAVPVTEIEAQLAQGPDAFRRYLETLDYRHLHGAKDDQPLDDLRVIQLGKGTYLHFSYAQLTAAEQPAAAAPSAPPPMMALMLPFFLALLLMSALLWPAPGQAVELQLHRVEANAFPLLEVELSVLENGNPVEGLQARQFAIKIDEAKKFQPIDDLSTGHESSTPNYIVLMLDKSGSMQYKSSPQDQLIKMEAARRAATAFVDEIRLQDRVAVISFDDKIVETDFTGSMDQIKKQIKAVDMNTHRSGRTNMHEALYRATKLLTRIQRQVPDSRLSVVLMTDGAHNVPTEYTLQDSLKLAQTHQLTLYTIGFGDRKAPKGSAQYMDEQTLRQLAHASQGAYYYAANAKELESVYGRIIRAIKGRYTLLYRLQQQEPDPWSHQIQIRLQEAGRPLGELNSAYTLSGAIPTGGSLGQRSLAVLSLLPPLLLLLLGGPRLLRGLDRALRPQAKPPSLRESALALWTEPAFTPSVSAANPTPEPEPEPEVAPPTAPPKTKKHFKIRRVEETDV